VFVPAKVNFGHAFDPLKKVSLLGGEMPGFFDLLPLE